VAENLPTLEEWRRLYEAAMRVKELAPWEWMVEMDLCGVQNPETDELGFVSVMGQLGEHYAVAVYLGPQGLYRFWAFEDAGPSASDEQFFQMPHLQASFEDRQVLRDKDREVIKALGLKFRGRQAWPLFRSYRPGFFPWFLEAAEARFLTIVLEQVLDVAPRFRDDQALLLDPGLDERYMVRVARREGGALSWEDRVVHVPPPELPTIDLVMDVKLLERLKRVTRRVHRIEVDFSMFPTPVQEERGARPQFAYQLLTVESQSGVVLGDELLTADPSLERMWGQVPLHFVRQLARLDMLPEEVAVRSESLLRLLQPLGEELQFTVERSGRLHSLDAAKKFLLQRFT